MARKAMWTEMERPRSGAATIWILQLTNKPKTRGWTSGCGNGKCETQKSKRALEHLIFVPRLERRREPIKMVRNHARQTCPNQNHVTQAMRKL